MEAKIIFRNTNVQVIGTNKKMLKDADGIHFPSYLRIMPVGS